MKNGLLPIQAAIQFLVGIGAAISGAMIGRADAGCRTKRAALLLPLLVLLSGCLEDLGVGPVQLSGDMTDAEYAVLAAIVDSLVASPRDSMLVLHDSTSCGLFEYDLDSAMTRVFLRMSQETPSLNAETTRDFKAKNLTHTYIREPVRIHPKCVRSSSTTAYFPMLEVSRVGFSADGQQALAYVGHSGAPLSGYGVYFLLSQLSGRWTIIAEMAVWIS